MRSFISVLICICAAFAAAQGYSPKPGETVIKIVIEGKGNVFVLLHTKEAPLTTGHILGLVNQKFYDGQRFFKAIKSPRPYLVQLGDPNTKGQGVDFPGVGQTGTGARIPFEESGFSNEEGAVGLSTLPKDKDSGDSQFYMLLAPATYLDGSYTVFGKVVYGMDVVRRIDKGDRVSSISVVGRSFQGAASGGGR